MDARRGPLAALSTGAVSAAGHPHRRGSGSRGPRQSFCLRPDRPPGLTDRRVIEPFGVEHARRRRQVLLAFANPPTPAECGEQALVHARIERRKLEPLLEVAEQLVARGRCRQVLQQRRVAAAEPAPLRREPAVERGVAIDLEAVQELALEEGAERPQSIGRQRLDALLRGAGNLHGIDETIREIEPDAVPGRIDPAPTRPVEDAPELAQAPAQLAARIVGHVPEQLAQADTRHGLRGKGEIGRERAHLARTRQCHVRPVRASDRHGAEQFHMQQGPTARRVRSIRFHWHFHAGYHTRLHARPLQLRSTGNGAYPASDPAPRKAGVNDRHRSTNGERS